MYVVEDSPFKSFWLWMGWSWVCEKIEASKGYQQECQKRLPFEWWAKSRKVFFAAGVYQDWSDVWQQLAALLWAVAGMALYNTEHSRLFFPTSQQIRPPHMLTPSRLHHMDTARHVCCKWQKLKYPGSTRSTKRINFTYICSSSWNYRIM